MYDGEGYIGSTLFITETRGNDTDGKPQTYYYYWVGGPTEVSDKTRANAGKKRPSLTWKD